MADVELRPCSSSVASSSNCSLDPHDMEDILSVESEETNSWHDDDDNEDDDAMPLVSSPDTIHRRRPFELDYRDEDASSWFGDAWRMTGSILLSAILLVPLLYSYYHKHHPSMTHDSTTHDAAAFDIPSEWWKMSDNQKCARDLSIQYSQLHDEIQQADNYCSPTTNRASCTCRDPFTPIARVQSTPRYWKDWDKTFERNKQLATNATYTENLDVVLLGDSITEHWQGTGLGHFSQTWAGVYQQYTELFQSKDGVHGLALGISGDRCPQLLWRLENGELPDTLNPRVFWLLIGTNDLGGDQCSKEAVLIGILNIVLSIKRVRPKSTIVINSILPRSLDATGRIDKDDDKNKKSIEPTIWDDIVWINQRLECFVGGSTPKQLRYFDATWYFLLNETHLDKSLMPDNLHPNGKGAHVWGSAIVDYLEKEVLKSREHGPL